MIMAMGGPPQPAASGRNVVPVRTHVVRGVLAATPETTVGAVLDRMWHETLDSAFAAYVCDAEGRFIGAVPIKELFRQKRTTAMADALGARRNHAVSRDLDEEAAALYAVENGVAELPVVDAAGRLHGVMPAAAIARVLHAEHVQDVSRMAGIVDSDRSAREALEAPPLRQVRRRLPWLMVGLAGSMAATALMAGFEEMLARDIVVAFFIPALVYLCDAVGTQTEAVAVRGLAHRHRPFSRLLLNEIATGALMGLILAAVISPLVAVVFDDLRLGLVLGVSVLAASATASATGLGLPLLLAALGIDPAFGSGPLATIIQDMLTLVVYFGVVSMVWL